MKLKVTIEDVPNSINTTIKPIDEHNATAEMMDSMAGYIRPDSRPECRQILGTLDLVGMVSPIAALDLLPARTIVGEFKLFWNIPVRQMQSLSKAEFSAVKAAMKAMSQTGDKALQVMQSTRVTDTLVRNEMRAGQTVVFEYTGNATEQELARDVSNILEWGAKQAEAEGDVLNMIVNFNGAEQSLVYRVGTEKAVVH